MKKFLINLKLVVKILLCVMIPLSMTMIVGVLGIVNTSSILGCKLEEDHLDTAGYAIEKMLDQIGSDTYTLQGDNLYKGSVNLTKDNTFMDEFKKRSNIDTTIFYGNVRRSSNIEDESGMSVIGTTMDPDVYAKVKRDGKIIFDKEFTATLLQLSTIKEPIWITESGLLGSLNYGDIPEKTLMVKAFDPNEKELTYHLTPGYILPEGLWIDNSTGQIKGKCDSQ